MVLAKAVTPCEPETSNESGRVVRVQKVQKGQKKLGKSALRVKLSETHAIPIAVGWRPLVGVTVGRCSTDLSEDDDTSRAPVNAKRAPGTDIVVNEEDRVVAGISAGQFGSESLIDGGSANQMDALPRANIDTAFAGDAFGLVDVDELLGLDRL
jgi:hypothetical protein